jgi:hypothetical protein
MRRARFAYDDLERRRAEIGARIRCRRVMMVNAYCKPE